MTKLAGLVLLFSLLALGCHHRLPVFRGGSLFPVCDASRAGDLLTLGAQIYACTAGSRYRWMLVEAR